MLQGTKSVVAGLAGGTQIEVVNRRQVHLALRMSEEEHIQEERMLMLKSLLPLERV